MGKARLFPFNEPVVVLVIMCTGFPSTTKLIIIIASYQKVIEKLKVLQAGLNRPVNIMGLRH